PRNIVMKLYNNLVPMLKSADTAEKFLAQGAIPSGMEPDLFEAYIKNEAEKWAKVAKATGVMAE
ncbi:MAG: tripartite tricarboxylate transporter substrate binding protein, partial [Betaproteobacteria bacterium]